MVSWSSGLSAQAGFEPATFLVAPKGQPGIEPRLQLHCMRVLATGLLTQPDAEAEREQNHST